MILQFSKRPIKTILEGRITVPRNINATLDTAQIFKIKKSIPVNYQVGRGLILKGYLYKSRCSAGIYYQFGINSNLGRLFFKKIYRNYHKIGVTFNLRKKELSIININ